MAEIITREATVTVRKDHPHLKKHKEDFLQVLWEYCPDCGETLLEVTTIKVICCSSCLKRLAKRTEFCPHCGVKFEKAEETK